MTPTMIANYRIVRELGAGGMGVVYEAVDQMLERRVAIKAIKEEIAQQPDLIERFRAEAVMLARLSHSSIATLYSFFREGDRYFMVMEFVEGRTVEKLLTQSGAIAPATSASILRQTLDAMAHAHRMGVLHRDIKPANIIVRDDGTAKVTDFGIARILGSSRMTRDGRIIGTLEYIAPERIRGEEADIRSDLYSAGVVLYEMLTGRLPFVRDTDFSLMQAHLNEPPPLEGAVPAQFEAVLERALAKSPAERFSSAEEFRDALASTVPTRPASALPPTRLAEVPHAAASSFTQPKVLAIAVLSAVLLLSGVTATYLVLRKSPEPQVASTAPVVETRATAPAPVAPVEPAPTTAQQPATALQLPTSVPNALPRKIDLGLNAPAPVASAPSTPRTITQAPSTTVQSPKTIAPAPETLVTEPSPSTTVAPATIVETPPTPPPKAVPATTVSTIRAVRRLYVEPMNNNFDTLLKLELREQLSARVQVVGKREGADAVMHGSAESKSGGRLSRLTGNYLGTKSGFDGSVSITTPSGDRAA
jgi:eukaryotic-like serine/threonine-protein kinase